MHFSAIYSQLSVKQITPCGRTTNICTFIHDIHVLRMCL